LLVGALLAVYPVRAGPAWLRQTAAIVGLVLLILPILYYNELTPFPGIAALPPVLGAATLIYAGFPAGGSPATPVNHALGTSLMVFIGRLSYPLYLVHWPIIVLVREATMREPGGATIAAMIAGSVAFAWAIHRWIEQPLRHAVADGRTVLRLAIAVLLLVASAGIVGVSARGAPGRLALPATQPLMTDARWGKGRCFFEGGANPLDWREAACVRSRAAGRKILLWGDSFAAHYVPGIEANAGNIAGTIVQYTAAACIPLLDTGGMTPTCRAFDAHLLDVVRQGRFTHVIIAARWQNWRTRGFDALPATIAALREAGASVTVIGQTPLFAADVQTIAYRSGAPADRTASWPIAVDREINQTLRQASIGANFVDPIAILCGADTCPYKAGSAFLFGDDGHFSAAGSSRAVSVLFPFIRKRAARGFGDPAAD